MKIKKSICMFACIMVMFNTEIVKANAAASPVTEEREINKRLDNAPDSSPAIVMEEDSEFTFDATKKGSEGMIVGDLFVTQVLSSKAYVEDYYREDNKVYIDIYGRREGAMAIIYEYDLYECDSEGNYGKFVETVSGVVFVYVKDELVKNFLTTNKVYEEKYMDRVNLSVESNNLTVYMGKNKKIKYEVSASGNYNTELSVKSYNTIVASVDSNFVITPKYPGTAKIIISSKSDPLVRQEINVVVKAAPISIKLKKSDITMKKGKKEKISPTIVKDYSYSDTIIYKSNNTNVVSVDSKGVMTANSQGVAVITVSSKKYPSVSKRIVVCVNNK